MNQVEFETFVKDIKEQINAYAKQGRWKERNELAKTYREAYRAHDFGFKVGEKVKTVACGRGWNEAVILQLMEENYFLILNEIGWEMVVDGTSLRKEGSNPQPPAIQSKHIEQLDLFTMMKCN